VCGGGRAAVDGIGEPGRVTVLIANGSTCGQRGLSEWLLLQDELAIEGVGEHQCGLGPYRPERSNERPGTGLQELRGPPQACAEPVDLAGAAAGVEEHQRAVWAQTAQLGRCSEVDRIKGIIRHPHTGARTTERVVACEVK